MSACPAAMAVTVPPAATATDELDDCQFARPVTFFDVPSESVAVALKLDELPTVGAVPVIDTAFTVGPEDGEEPDDPIVRCTWPDTFWYVAVISASPFAMPLT